MATDTEQLILSISADVSQVKRALDRLQGDAKQAGQGIEKAFNNVVPFNRMQADAKNLSFQLNDIATGLTTGQSPFIIMNQQMGQVLQLMGGRGLRGSLSLLKSAFATAFPALAFMGIVEGMRLLLESGDESEETLKKQRDLIQEVAREWGNALPAVAAYADHIGRVADEQKKLAAQKLLAGLPEVSFEDLATGVATFVNRLTELNSRESFAWANKLQDAIETARQKFADGEDASQAFAGVQKVLGEVAKDTNEEIRKLGTDGLDELRPKLNQTQTAFDAVSGTMNAGVENANKYADAMKKLGEISVQAANDARGAWEIANATATTVQEKIAAGAAFQKARQAEIAREQAGGIPTPTPRPAIELEADPEMERRIQQLNSKLDNAIEKRLSTAVDVASQFLGSHEIRDRAEVNAFLQSGGSDIDAAMTAWCAAFVNAALARVGVKGTGSAVATSFAKWGREVSPEDIAPGDVLTQMRGLQPGQTGGHVGLATGEIRKVNGELQALMVSGNQSNKVTEQWISLQGVAIRRATEVSGAMSVQSASYETFMQKQRQALETQLEENRVNVDSAMTLDQKRIATEAASIAQEMNNEATRNGITLTPQLRAEHLALATQMAQSGLAAQNMARAQAQAAQDAIAAAREQAQALENLKNVIAGMATQAITGFVQDLRNGVDAAEALYNAVSRIADQLLQMALQMAFKAILGGMGGPAGMLGGGLFAKGGYTGGQSTRAPAGIVHGKEFVINAAATQKHRGLLEAINNGVSGYASGGFVLPAMRGGQMPQNAPAASVDARTTVVNTFDSGSFLSEALSKPDGVKVILNAVRAQPGAFRQAMQA